MQSLGPEGWNIKSGEILPGAKEMKTEALGLAKE
jgi:hypothetical protein